MGVKELVKVLNFVWSVEFWRMGVCWTLSLIMAYVRLLTQRFFTRESKSYARCSTTVETMKSSAVRKPLCVITGVNKPITFASSSFFLRIIVVLVSVGS